MDINVKKSFSRLLFLFLITAAFGVHSAENEAGYASNIRGFVTATNTSGDIRKLEKGSAVYNGDLIETGKRSKAVILFSDESKYTLIEDTSFQIKNYNYVSAEDPNSSADFSITRGGLLAISGWIGKKFKTNYRMNTPLSTIGIRGTTYQIRIIRDKGDIEVQVATLDGAIVYSSINSNGTNIPLPPNQKQKILTVDTDDDTGDITNILIEAGKKLTQKEQGAVETALGRIFSINDDGQANDDDQGDDDQGDDDQGDDDDDQGDDDIPAGSPIT